mmetsp:Transcript_126649/g.358231  ORF Transcript_126649/g.358231 Transcript_126649/m.358231 type:complete len:209 (-) Transcript_126649:912-1538(-)
MIVLGVELCTEALESAGGFIACSHKSGALIPHGPPGGVGQRGEPHGSVGQLRVHLLHAVLERHATSFHLRARVLFLPRLVVAPPREELLGEVHAREVEVHRLRGRRVQGEGPLRGGRSRGHLGGHQAAHLGGPPAEQLAVHDRHPAYPLGDVERVALPPHVLPDARAISVDLRLDQVGSVCELVPLLLGAEAGKAAEEKPEQEWQDDH